MVLPLWGLLEKAQDDSETIEAAIARLITAHKNDPTSHLGAGESLELHKAEDIIDHPPGSVLPDKWSFSDFDFDTNFESLAGFTKTAGVVNTSWPGVSFDLENPVSITQTLRANLAGVFATGNMQHDYICDTYFLIDSSDSKEIINIGLTDNAMTTYYLGFRVTGGNLYGVARWSAAEQLTASLGSVSSPTIQFVRVFYDYGANLITFYLNGVSVGTMTPAAALQSSNQWTIKGQANLAEATSVRVYKSYISKGI